MNAPSDFARTRHPRPSFTLAAPDGAFIRGKRFVHEIPESTRPEYMSLARPRIWHNPVHDALPLGLAERCSREFCSTFHEGIYQGPFGNVVDVEVPQLVASRRANGQD